MRLASEREARTELYVAARPRRRDAPEVRGALLRDDAGGVEMVERVLGLDHQVDGLAAAETDAPRDTQIRLDEVRQLRAVAARPRQTIVEDEIVVQIGAGTGTERKTAAVEGRPRQLQAVQKAQGG